MESCPAGRVLNRFSTDVWSIDDTLPFVLNILLAQGAALAGTLVVTAYGLPWITLVLLPLGFGYNSLQVSSPVALHKLPGTHKRMASFVISDVICCDLETTFDVWVGQDVRNTSQRRILGIITAILGVAHFICTLLPKARGTLSFVLELSLGKCALQILRTIQRHAKGPRSRSMYFSLKKPTRAGSLHQCRSVSAYLIQPIVVPPPDVKVSRMPCRKLSSRSPIADAFRGLHGVSRVGTWVRLPQAAAPEVTCM